MKEGTLVWPNEADFCPDVLYKMGKEIQEQENQAITGLRHHKKNTNTKKEFRVRPAPMTKQASKNPKNKKRKAS